MNPHAPTNDLLGPMKGKDQRVRVDVVFVATVMDQSKNTGDFKVV